MRAYRLLGASIAVLAMAGPAAAQGELQGAKLVIGIKPAQGFVDDPFGFDGAGGRLLWINSDAAQRAELRVLDLAQGGAQLGAVDLSSFSINPVRADFVLDGNHYFVVARDSDEAPLTAALIDGAGKVVHRFGPATDIALHRGAAAEVVTYTREMQAGKKGPPTVTHTVDVFDLASGKRTSHRALISDDTGMVKKLDFRIVAFEADYTQAFGVKGGVWDKKEDQRTPDVEARYDMASGKFGTTTDIRDVMAHVKKQKLYADHPNQERFLMVAEDLSGLHLVNAGAATPVTLAEPFQHYDHKSLQAQPATASGSLLFTLTIDPVHPDAVARKRAVPEYIDLYELAPGATKAVRRARMRKTSQTGFRFRATSEYWAVLPLHLGFDRGGPELRVYRLD